MPICGLNQRLAVASTCYLRVRDSLRHRQSLSCFPRLHVITAEASHPRARSHFAGVPNVTFRDNAFPPIIANVTYLLIQIHILWADNFTSAPYLMYFDTDAVPVLPLRCQHIFDDEERLLLHPWARPGNITSWVLPDSEVFLHAQSRWGEQLRVDFTPQLQENDYMSFWPIVAPRALLPTVRRLLSREYGTYFDAAFAERTHGHADLIRKAALLLHPHAVSHEQCAPVGSPYATPHGDAAWPPSAFACARWVSAVEHVRHPMQGCHTSCANYKNYAQSAQYAHELLNQSAAFVTGEGPVPHKLWHYRHAHLTSEQHEATRAFLLREDAGRVCGLKHGRVPHNWHVAQDARVATVR